MNTTANQAAPHAHQPPQATPVEGVAEEQQSHLPRLDQLPLEVLSLVASLIPPPFYPPPPPDEPSSKPAAHVVERLDPTPPPEQTNHQAVSAMTKTCSHVLEAARPWLWENVDVRSGRGWLAVVDALTEEVVDVNEDEEEAYATGKNAHTHSPFEMSFAAHQTNNAGPSGSGAFRSSSHGPMHVVVSQSALSSGETTPSTAPTTPAPGQPSTLAPAAPVYPAGLGNAFPGTAANVPVPVQVSVPVGTGGAPRSIMSHTRSVTIDTSAAQAYLREESPRSAGGALFSPPQPRRLSMLLTPPGSRQTSPVNARLRGRSRSPRRNVAFDTEGITAVLQRSMSISHPGGGGYRPLQRQSSLSHSRVWEHTDSEEEMNEESRESLSAAMRTPPKRDSLELPPEEDPDAAINVNPELLPPPGPYIRHLSFTNFRTIGSRRSQAEAVNGRFVTAGRFEGVLKNAPNLRSLCMTEYVDSALSYPVVEEIFFRGYDRPRITRRRANSSPNGQRRSGSGSQSVAPPEPEPGQSTMDDQIDPPRPVYVPYEDETEEQKWARRDLFTPLEAIDLTGCVSRSFTQAANQFGENWLGLGVPDDSESDAPHERGRGRMRRRLAETDEDEDDDNEAQGEERHRRRFMFHQLRRLSLRACTALSPEFIQGLTLAIPNLTHLDLSATRVTNSLLQALTHASARGMRLQSLSFARCPKLDPGAVVDFLLESPAARDIIELNLYVNPTQGNAMESDDLWRLMRAPCIKSGMMRYLDLSSAGLTAAHLEEFPAQRSLVSLGLSHIPDLSLKDVANFLQNLAPGVEILTLTGSSINDLRPDWSTLQIMLTLHALLINPLTTMPFSIGSFDFSGAKRKADLSAGPTRLRVVELSSAIRRAIDASQGSGRTEWQVVKSKGGRGWYVDVSAGWIPARDVDDWGHVEHPVEVGEGTAAMAFVRHLPATHPRRVYVTRLAEQNGRVRSDVGWHSRKMEVVQGDGMLGREEGMGGVGAFASAE